VALVEAHDVLGFQVSVEDTHLVTVLNALKELKEDVLDSVVLCQIPTLVEDLVKEVAGGGVFHDEVSEHLVLDRSVTLDNPGVSRHLQMEIELAYMRSATSFGFAHTLDCVLATPLVRDVDAEEDDTVAPVPEDANELDSVVVDEGP
jgi:hypothetical protein